MKLNLLHKMLVAFFLLCLSIQIPNLYGTPPIDDINNRPLIDVLKELSETYEVFVSFDESLIQDIKVDFKIQKEETFEVSINRLLVTTGLEYKYLGTNFYVIYRNSNKGKKKLKKLERNIRKIQSLQSSGEVSLEPAVASSNQRLKAIQSSVTRMRVFDKEVSGAITDGDGNPLVGATVRAKGTNKGALTDSDGKFKLEVPDDVNTLVVSYIGFATQEVAIDGRSIVDIRLEAEASTLDEVVVTGYGTQKKANLTGAVSVITSEALENRPIASVGQGLQGLVPNLNVSIRNGDPTVGASFNIRGYESINGGSPLILVDGVPMALERINPNDIESVNVLKDASAAAVYGARAAFGVILVETKRGKQGKVNIQLSTELTAAKPIFNMDPITDPYEFVLARNTASIRTSGNPSYNDDFVAAVKAFSEGTGPEWGVLDGTLQFYGNNGYQDRVMTDFSPQQKYDLSISGATEKASYYVSIGHLSKDGYLKHDTKNEYFKRYNVLMKAEFKVTDWLTLEEKIVYNGQQSDKPTFYHWDVNVNTLARQDPLDRVQFPDLDYYLVPGDRAEYEPYIGMYFAGTNFLPYLEDGGRRTFNVNDTWLTQGVTITPLSGLTLKGNFSYNTYHRNYQDVQSKIEVIENNDLTDLQIGNGFSGSDWIENSINFNQYFTLNAYAEYLPELGDNHYLKALVGFNQEWGINESQRARAFSLITPLITDLNATVGGQQTFGSKSHVALRGAFYRLNYILKDKYLFEATGRYDGTSRFPKEDRFGFFPSFSAGWRVSEEGFMEGTRGFLDDLKIRASYGTLGNQLLGNNYYPYIATMGIGTSPYMMSGGARTPFVSPAGLVSPTLTWETVITKNIGVDITALNQRLTASVDIYTRDTKDMLMRVEFPSVLGTNAPNQNAADLRTKGWELTLGWRDRVGSDWRYRIGFNLADWQSEITKYDNPTGALSEYYVGQQIGEIWGYETVGIFQTEEELNSAADQSRLGANWRTGDIHYRDLDGDGEITPGNNTLEDPGDRTIIGNESPRYSYGINFDLHYKSFSITTFFQGIGQRDYWPQSGNWRWFFPFNAGHVEKYYITDTWREDNRDAYFPAAHLSTSDGKNKHTQSRFVQNASYIRLKNVTLNYQLPTALVSRIGLGGISIYGSGMNLWEYTKMRKPLDPEYLQREILAPELNNNGAVEYPLQRLFAGGIRISF